jgi:hypothetical protein
MIDMSLTRLKRIRCKARKSSGKMEAIRCLRSHSGGEIQEIPDYPIEETIGSVSHMPVIPSLRRLIKLDGHRITRARDNFLRSAVECNQAKSRSARPVGRAYLPDMVQ